MRRLGAVINSGPINSASFCAPISRSGKNLLCIDNRSRCRLQDESSAGAGHDDKHIVVSDTQAMKTYEVIDPTQSNLFIKHQFK